jgi:hypothetical protein
MNDALDAARKVLDGYRDLAEAVRDTASGTRAAPKPPPKVPAGTLRAAIRQLLVAFTASMKWSVEIPGQHYGGLSNQALLEVRKREGRDFDADTVQLKQHVRKELLERFASFPRVPTIAEIEDLAGKLIVQRLTERVMHGGLDVNIPPVTAATAARKRRDGFGGKPAGVRRGKWLAALRRARVTFEKR